MLTPITLYRATSDVSDADTVPDGTCWAERREDAVAYQTNFGFGGPHIVSVTVSDRYAGSILDLRGGDHWEDDDWAALAEALGYAGARELRQDHDDGEHDYIEQFLDDPRVRAQLAAVTAAIGTPGADVIAVVTTNGPGRVENDSLAKQSDEPPGQGRNSKSPRIQHPGALSFSSASLGWGRFYPSSEGGAPLESRRAFARYCVVLVRFITSDK